MIKLTRSMPAPEELEFEKNKASGKYNIPSVVERLKNDFHNKCYLCESKSETFNIEHLVSHEGNVDLKFDWENLFLSCGHCNNLKLNKYDNILDCTKEEIHNKIFFKMNPYPLEEVEIRALIEDERVKITVELLKLIYNGTTSLKKIEASNLRKSLLNELRKFQGYLMDYSDAVDSNDDENIEYWERKIQAELRSNSQFVAFKRDIIAYNRGLNNIFGEFVQTQI